MTPNELPEDVRGRIASFIEARVNELEIDWQDIPDRGGPSASKVREFVRGRSRTFTQSKRRELEKALGWAPGSFEAMVAGGQPTPDLPDLPRGAYYAPTLGNINVALGQHPNHPQADPHLTRADRQLLLSVRNKLIHNRNDFTEAEQRALTTFVEDDELRNLHARIDWLPRPEQLEVSALVTELEARVDQRLADMGVTCETEELPPDAPRAHPLPREGVFPESPLTLTFPAASTSGVSHLDFDTAESRALIAELKKRSGQDFGPTVFRSLGLTPSFDALWSDQRSTPNLNEILSQHVPGSFLRFEITTDEAGKFRFRLKAANGEVIATSDAYESKASAKNVIESMRNSAPGAAVVDLTE